jgi:hypothetical protein
MAEIFFPSCKVSAGFPAESRRIRRYLEERGGVSTWGCCRSSHGGLTAKDSVIVVCNNCAGITEEASAAESLIYAWEIIDRDPTFPFPDYGGEAMTVQDCWAAAERRSMQEAIRSLLRKMNVTVVEQEENYDKTRYHGTALLVPCVPSNAELMPRRYEGGHSPLFTPMSEAQQRVHLKKYTDKITTEKVVCTCKFCRDGINLGGKTGVHIIELLFPDDDSTNTRPDKEATA